MNTVPHKWTTWTTAEIRKYLGKYTEQNAPGKCSSHRRKKIRFLQNTLRQREKAERLILGRV